MKARRATITHPHAQKRSKGRKRLSLALGLAASLGLGGLTAKPAAAQDASTVFNMQVSPGAVTCLPRASGRVTVSSLGPVENLHVEVFNLRPNTDYDLFLIQVPNAPFGLS